MLSWRPLVALGLISYGVYLYHLGIFMVLSESRTGLSGLTLALIRWAVTLGVATLSYLFVEQPIRRGITWTPPRIALGGAAVVVAVLVLFVTTLARTPSTFAEQADAHSEVSVLVAGDDLAYSMAAHSTMPVEVGGIRAAVVANAGCGIAQGTVVIASTKLGTVECPNKWPDLYTRAVKGVDPQVAVLMLGQGSAFDREVDGKIMRAGTPELERYLDAQLDKARSILTAKGATLVLTTAPCLDPGPSVPSAFAGVLRDRARTRWLNTVWTRYAHEHPGVEIADLDSVLCPNGNAHAKAGGAELRPDGESLSAHGVHYVWKWLAPIVVATHRSKLAAGAGAQTP
jgi:hypothetical protein